jgi:hypothetical protein
MLLRLCLISIFIAILCLSCGPDNPAGSAAGDNFRLKISIHNDQNQPLQNLRISTWNVLNGVQLSYSTETQFLLARPLFSTSVRFDLPVTCRAKLIAYNLNNSQIQPLIDSVFDPGVVNVIWGNSPSLPGGIYKLVLRTTDTATSQALYHDSIFATLWILDPEANAIGYTNSSGTYETTDKALFPALFNLPEMSQLNESGNIIGTFRVSDTVVITVTDTMTFIQQEYRKIIGKGQNDLSLLWSPPQPAKAELHMEQADKIISVNVDRRDQIPSEFKLYQNYPNPFN